MGAGLLKYDCERAGFRELDFSSRAAEHRQPAPSVHRFAALPCPHLTTKPWRPRASRALRKPRRATRPGVRILAEPVKRARQAGSGYSGADITVLEGLE